MDNHALIDDQKIVFDENFKSLVEIGICQGKDLDDGNSFINDDLANFPFILNKQH